MVDVDGFDHETELHYENLLSFAWLAKTLVM